MKIWTHQHRARKQGPDNPLVDADIGPPMLVNGKFRVGARDLKDTKAYWVEFSIVEIEAFAQAAGFTRLEAV